MIEDLPVDVYRDILNGRLSPVPRIRVTDKEGNTVTARARFIQASDPQGNGITRAYSKAAAFDDPVTPVTTAIDI